MLAVTKIAEVKEKVQPVVLEEAPQLKHVVIRSKHNSCIEKGSAIWPCLFHFELGYNLLIDFALFISFNTSKGLSPWLPTKY
jgi:hypothetical protein